MAKGSTFEQRKYPRVRTETALSVARLGFADELAWSVDLSLGGVRFRSLGFETGVGELLRVTLNRGENQEVSAVGKVVHITQIDSCHQELALAFIEVDAETNELLRGCLEDAYEV